MTKYDAFSTQFKMGVLQVETATAVGACTSSNNITITTTSAGMAGSPLDTTVAITNGDSADTWAEKVRTALRLVAVITARFTVGGSGPYITLTHVTPAVADDNTLNIAIAAGSTGITADATSDNTTAGAVSAAIAAVSGIGGPNLALDTVGVTTHDSTSAFEEVVSTILRSGEVTLELVYDPAEDSQDFTAVTGIGYALKNKWLCDFAVVFPDGAGTTWRFPGYVTGYTPGAPVDGALTASITIKIAGAPSLS